MEGTYLLGSYLPPMTENWNTDVRTTQQIKGQRAQQLACLDERREAFEEQLLATLEGEFPLIVPLQMADAMHQQQISQHTNDHLVSDDDPEEEEDLMEHNSMSIGDEFSDSYESEIDEWLEQ